MSTPDQKANYDNELMNNFWDDMCKGYYNYGRIAPDANIDDIPNLIQANEDMVDYIISNQSIGPDSVILDLGCGRGMYTVRIAKLTGCKFVGVDLNEKYVLECRERAIENGVENQGTFHATSMLELGEEIVGRRYTHVLVLGAMLFCHGSLDSFLQGPLRACCQKDTKVYIWDFVRRVDWEKCCKAQEHLKLTDPLLTKEDVFAAFARAGFELIMYEDVTKYIIPGCLILSREANKRDPQAKVLTSHLMTESFTEGLTAYVIYVVQIMK